MLKNGHLDRNSTQFCSDLSKEKLKGMMLNQDLVHMGQVFELHRLYRIQIAMAEDIKQKGLGNHNSHVRDFNSSPANNNQVNQSMGDIRRSTPSFKQKPLDLQLSADDFIRQSAGGVFRNSPFESKNKDSVTFDLNLSLNIGEERRSWLGKSTCANPPEIIDLEDPNSKYSNCGADHLPSVFSTPKFSFRDYQLSERSIISDKRNIQIFSKIETRHVSDGSSSSRPFINANQAYQRPPSCDSGIIDKSISRKAIMLDLNTIHIEDMTDLSHTHSEVVNPLVTAFSQSIFASSVSPTSGRELHIGNYAEIPNTHVQNNPKSGANIIRDFKPRDNKNNNNNKGKLIYIDLASDSDEEHCSSGSGPKIESVGSSSKVSDGLSCEFETSQAVVAEATIETDMKSSCQNLLVTEQPGDQVLSNSSQSECVTMQHGVNGGDSKFTSSGDCQLFEAKGISKVPDQKNSERPDLNSLSFESKESEVRDEVKNAAGLLMQISLQKAEKIAPIVFVRKEHDQPLRPSDSYEAMVLNTKECGPEDYCISSNAFDVDVSEKKDSRSKLKRGRSRTKDFQTEVLSSLSTLARHEIREDINAFQGAMRSREYKRRAKMSGAGDWSTPTRGKRSRISRR